MAEPLPPQLPRRARPEPPQGRAARRSLAVLALLGAGSLLVSCATVVHGPTSAPGHPRPHRTEGAPTTRLRAGAAPGTGGGVGAGGPLPPPAPVRILGVAYPAPTPTPPAPGGRVQPRAGAVPRRPHPAPGRPAAPPPPPRRVAGHTAAHRVPPRGDGGGICDLGTSYGGWPLGSVQENACHAVYG
ncbi:hypothetical protein [Streptacidiphilus sp. P02-A3a]|uniref:hypothetical protein n=1 Tax=Streptacidiphilus sp. P02-A3a TaxID=2704468 RepID=UPI0015FDFC1B|nr:hypothetical protein [Streptacidiphilus sp. P02-A3a]QMU67749.1 hypothetical protein GXP74_05415 [Streptacidiphilus sp. P02-A3a]